MFQCEGFQVSLPIFFFLGLLRFVKCLVRRGFGNNGDYAFIMILIVIMKTRHGPGEFARHRSQVPSMLAMETLLQ